MKKITVKTKKELEQKIREYRVEGYTVTTYGYTLVEMEKENELVVIEKKRK
jgi:hypothetical protein